MRLVFLGAPGVGKGTQAKLLSEREGLAHISTGDLLRDAVSRKTRLGLAAKEIMDRGDLVGDDIVLGLIEETLGTLGGRGFVLDGFPRTQAQAEGLDGLLRTRGESLDGVVNLTAPDEEVVQRLLDRGRPDDTPETVRHRLETYRRKTAPLIDRYEKGGLLVKVDGVGDIEAIQDRVRRALNGAVRG